MDDDFLDPIDPARRRPIWPIWLAVGGFAFVCLVVVALATVGVVWGWRDARRPAGAQAAIATGAVPPASAADCEALGLLFEEAVWSRDAAAVGELIDWKTLTDRAAAGLDLSATARTQFYNGARASSSKSGLALDLINTVSQGGDFSYLRVVERDGQRRALCRFVQGEGAFGFIELLPTTSGGRQRAADAFVYGSGEDLSATIRRVLIPIAAHENRGILEKLAGAENDLISHMQQIQEIAAARRQADWPAVLEIYDRLPTSLQREKFVLIQAMEAAMMTDESRYLRLIGTYRSSYPKDPALDLHLIDFYFLRQEFNDAIATLERLDDRVGGDGYVQYLIAGVYLEKGETAKAGKVAVDATAREPGLVYTHVVAIGAAVVGGKHALAVERIENMGRFLEIDPQGLHEAIAMYAHAEEFFASQEFRAWQAKYERGTGE